MVYYELRITAELENLTEVQPQGGCDDSNFVYYVKLKCGNCGEIGDKETCLSMDDVVPHPTGKGTCHLVRKCKFCGREATVNMLPGYGRPLSHIESQFGKYAALMVFDCRNVEPVEFSFGSGWKAESIEGTKFEDIDLSAGEYADYDEKGECPVMISNLRSTFSIVNLK
ncbi:OLC1v1029170C1 [Oldenlandia corymbosa var. corymbosa]|uniref:OLC1v1029170C1 n=1 Tax=Oldenlandia corymbosa var. corymbosa TaxID=529605 RepID=A0AAV1CF22_OLDCO|nr:OLC1v1029170C1 [Oldenlandia corymbosa var. corymbosa]